jgi:hypothetical protein
MEDDYEEEESDPDTSEQNVYKKKSREKLVENDEISDAEEGFMTGYEDDEEESEDEEPKEERQPPEE